MHEILAKALKNWQETTLYHGTNDFLFPVDAFFGEGSALQFSVRGGSPSPCGLGCGRDDPRGYGFGSHN